MKKLIPLLFFLLSAFQYANAQNNVYTKSMMVILVTEAKKTFVKQTSIDNWKREMLGSAVPTLQENAVLSDIYKFVSTNQNPESVFKNYDGASLLAFARTKNGNSAISESAARCGFRCMILILLEWFDDNIDRYDYELFP